MEDINLITRILAISYKNTLSHLGSYFSSVDIIDQIYSQKEEDDIFILSAGHCATALYVVIEKYYGIGVLYFIMLPGSLPGNLPEPPGNLPQ